MITYLHLFPIYKLDFRHSLDDNLNPEPINLIIDSYINNKKVDNIYYFLHLCTHFFDEAKHIVDIELFKDLNIIKLCDIREFYLQNQSRLSVKEFANFTNRFNFGEQVFFTMSFLKAIYNDGYEDKILELINYDNSDTLISFGDNAFESNQFSQKDIFERLFSCRNIDDIVAPSKLGIKKINNELYYE